MPKTKRKNRKLRNKKRTRKIYQKGGGLGSDVNKYIKHTKRNQAIWNNGSELYKPLNAALEKENTKIKNSIKKRRNKDIGMYVNLKMKEAKTKFRALKRKLEKHTNLWLDSPPDQTLYQTTNLTFVYDPNDRDKEFNQDEIRDPWNEWNEIRNMLIGLCGVISNKRNNELINFLLNLYNPSNFGSCNRSASSGETKSQSQSVVEGKTIEPVDPQVVGYKLHEMKHNIACLGYLKQIKLKAEPHSGMEGTPSIDEKLCIIQEKDVCKSIYKYLKEILYITDTTTGNQYLYTHHYNKKWDDTEHIEIDKLNLEYGKLVIKIENQKNEYKEKQAKKRAKKQARKGSSEQRSLADSVPVARLVANPLLQSVRGPDDHRLEGERKEFHPPSSASSDRPPPFIPPPPVKPPPNKPQGATKTGGIEMREYTCSTHPNKEMCLRVPNKCQWNPVKNECKDIPPKFTEGYNLSELQKSLKMKINRLLTKNFKETRDINFLKIEQILNYRNNPDAWLPVEMDDRLHRELLILELLKTTKKIKERLATARTASERPANINKLDEAILQVQSEIQLFTGDLQLAMPNVPNVPNVPEYSTSGESKGTNPPPRRVYSGQALQTVQFDAPKSLGTKVLGRPTHPAGSPEAKAASMRGPDPTTGIKPEKVHVEVDNEPIVSSDAGADGVPVTTAILEVQPDKVDEIRPAEDPTCTVEIMPVPKLKGADNKNKKKKKKKREETKQACEEKGGEVVKVDKKNVTCKKCPVNDLLELIKELEIRRQ